MLDFQQKRKVRSFLYNRTMIVILAIVVVFGIHSTWQVYQKQEESEKMKNVAELHVSELQTRNKELQDQMSRLSTNEGIEEEIRSKFSVAKGDENMVVIVDDTSSNTATTTNSQGWWQKIKHSFGF